MKRLTTIRSRSTRKPFQGRSWPRASVLAGASIAIMILTGRAGSGAGQDASPVSRTAIAGAPDILLKDPYVDADEWRDTPFRHRYVHGGFKGTPARFSIYFPPKDLYQGRFFQHVTPTPIDEKEGTTGAGTGDQVGFAFASGGYFLVTNEGGMTSLRSDPTLGAYRANAAAAQYSRVLAAQMYGAHRTYGYAYGGSGGAFRTIGGFENTTGVWDGVVPYVVGSPQAIPNVFTVRLLALRVLKDKFPAIVDAMEPGGSGNIYSGLNKEEREVLAEVTALGFPVQSWSDYRTIGTGAFPILFETVIQKDPAYFEDFWKVPGYEGARPPESLLRSRVQQTAIIKKVISREQAANGASGSTPQRNGETSRGGVDTAWQQLKGAPAGFEVETVPAGDLQMATVTVTSGEATGTAFPLGKVDGHTIFVGTSLAAMMSGGTGNDALRRVKPGDEVRVDNSDCLAVQYYHRHQVPAPDFYVWDQFRGRDGKPLFPQRPRLIGPEFAASAGGSTQSGRFQGKMIVVESLWDQDAFPWQADWYASKVKTALGPRVDDNFRLWFIDHALHGDVEAQFDPTHTVSYVGALQQALRDLSAWVEKGVAPPDNTMYKVVNGQVEVPSAAAQRGGVQPIVSVLANGKTRAEVKIGQPVTLSAVIEAPPNTGRVVFAEWSLGDTNEFTPAALSPPEGPSAALQITHTYSKAGTYFVVLRAASQREGDAKTPYARIQNLGRMRVVVR
jgi:hypothetical protein